MEKELINNEVRHILLDVHLLKKNPTTYFQTENCSVLNYPTSLLSCEAVLAPEVFQHNI